MNAPVTRIGRIFLMQVIMLLSITTVNPVYGQDRQPERREMISADVKSEAGDDSENSGDYLSEKKEGYLKKTEELIHGFEGRVKRLYQRAETSGIRTKEKLSTAADMIRRKTETAKIKLKELKAAGNEKWSSFRNEMDSIMQDIERTYRRTISKFNVKDEDNANKEDR